ncbi:MAG: putative membrane protein [Candidatus Woesearchaeota archaeon]|jgi:uncharacterized membrane protein
MNKREASSLGIFLVSFFLLGFVLFSGVDTQVNLTLENGKTVATQVPINFSLFTVIFLVVFSLLAGGSGIYYLSDISTKLELTRKQKVSVRMLDGDLRKMYTYLLEKEECLQKDLVYELQIPKVKVTRLLDKLDEKGLIKRISFGKTNKIIIE